MSVQSYDIAVIGAGPAGEKAAIEASSLGARVAIIEKGINPGGASVITGTIPSKSLRETVKFVESLSQSVVSGVRVSPHQTLTVPELMYRKNRVIEQRIEDILATYHSNNVDFIFGSARFVSPDELEITQTKESQTRRLKARKFIIAVGTNPYHPSDLQFDGKFILDSDTILTLEKIPESLAVIGGGVIGCEYATIFAKLGTRVTLIDALDTVLSFVDRDISSELVKEMEKDGICLKLGHSYERVEVVNHQVSIELSSGETLKTAALLCASGRQGMADQLNLGVCGVEINSRNQLEVNANYQTKVPHIYAVGDVIGFPSLVSVSNEEGRMAAQHAVNQTTVHRVGADIPFGIYTIPEISMIGYTEAQLKKENIPYAVGRCYCKDLARGLIIGDRRGLFKLLFHRQTHELLGVHIFSQSAAELIHIGQSVINFKGKIEYFIDTVFNFPTLSAAYKVAARDGLNQL